MNILVLKASLPLLVSPVFSAVIFKSLLSNAEDLAVSASLSDVTHLLKMPPFFLNSLSRFRFYLFPNKDDSLPERISDAIFKIML